MDLKSGYPYWPIHNGLLGVYPPLTRDETCDIAIIGGGITGALVAHHLVDAGLDTVVVDRRDVAHGSTAASTALLQYEIDVPLHELAQRVGLHHAQRCYLLNRDAIDLIARLVRRLDDRCGFERKFSLQIASTSRDATAIKVEHDARRAIGIDVQLLTAADIKRRFPFRASAGLWSSDAARIDPYRFTHALLRHAQTRGLRIFDRTEVTRTRHHRKGVTLTTDRGPRIHARRLVIATGYESGSCLPRGAVTYRSTYALVSEPVADLAGWHEQCLIWETARPYLYMTPLRDGRVMLGGEDDPWDHEGKRARRLPRKTQRLVKRFSRMFPAIAIEPAYAWAGVFGETRDGLAYIGPHPHQPRTHLALGFGGNGITHSLIAARILRDLLTGVPNPDTDLFRLDR